MMMTTIAPRGGTSGGAEGTKDEKDNKDPTATDTNPKRQRGNDSPLSMNL
jgi:hypothetical protein